MALCDFSEKPLLNDIEKLMGRKVPVVEDHPWPMEVFEAPKRDKNGKPINAEDAEARAAAKELRRMRDQSQKETLQRKAAQAQQKGQEAGEQEEKRSRSRRRKKKAGQSEGVPPAPHPPPSRITRVPSAAPNHPSEEYVPAR